MTNANHNPSAADRARDALADYSAECEASEAKYNAARCRARDEHMAELIAIRAKCTAARVPHLAELIAVRDAASRNLHRSRYEY